MTKNKVMSYLGLATRAGKVQSGEFSTEKSVKSGRAALVMVAEDASDNTKKKFTNMCTYLYLWYERDIGSFHWERTSSLFSIGRYWFL